MPDGHRRKRMCKTNAPLLVGAANGRTQRPRSRQAKSLGLGGYGSGGKWRSKRDGYRAGATRGRETANIVESSCGASPTTGMTHTAGQAVIPFPSGALSGHPVQSPPPDMPIPDIMLILIVISLV